jgi:hypothetical protein
VLLLDGALHPLHLAVEVRAAGPDVAVADAQAADRWGVSEHAVWKWAEEVGGLRALRELYETRRMAGVSAAAVSISHEVQRRVGRLSERNLVALFLELAKSLGYADRHVSTTIVNAPQARAEAGTVRVHDGPDRVGTIIRILAEAGVLLAPPPAEAEQAP